MESGALWSARDRRWLLLLLLVGTLMVLGAWFFSAGEADPADQLPFASLAVLGSLIGMYGVFTWVAHGRRLVGQRTRLLLGVAPAVNVDLASAETLVGGGDRHWFHRSDCTLAKARNWPLAPRRDHEAAGRKPCPACRP